MIEIQVIVYATYHDFLIDEPFKEYTMNHNDTAQRRVLGEQCRNAFDGGQVIVTFPSSIVKFNQE